MEQRRRRAHGRRYQQSAVTAAESGRRCTETRSSRNHRSAGLRLVTYNLYNNGSGKAGPRSRRCRR